MKKVIGFYPCPDVDTAGTQVVSHAGTVLLTETITRVGLDHALSSALAAVAAPAGGARPGQGAAGSRARVSRSAGTVWPMSPCCAPSPAVFGLVASDPTVSRTIDRLAHDATAVAGRDRHRPRRGPRPGVDAGR